MSDIERTGLAQQEFDRWSAEAEQVAEESQELINSQKRFLGAQEAFDDWEEYLSTLTTAELDMALKGLKEYAETFTRDMDITQGWARYENET